MHEVGIMRDTIDIVLGEARKAGASSVHRVRMRVGDLSGVVPEALEFAFEVVTRGTPAEGALFEVERSPVVCRCAGCGDTFRPADIVYECPRCRRVSAELLQGRELELLELEVS